MPKKRNVFKPWEPRPIHPVFLTEVERAAAQYRVDRRSAGRTSCACGADATVCYVGPPTIWQCQPCADAAWAEERAMVAATLNAGRIATPQSRKIEVDEV